MCVPLQLCHCLGHLGQTMEYKIIKTSLQSVSRAGLSLAEVRRKTTANILSLYSHPSTAARWAITLWSVILDSSAHRPGRSYRPNCVPYRSVCWSVATPLTYVICMICSPFQGSLAAGCCSCSTRHQVLISCTQINAVFKRVSMFLFLSNINALSGHGECVLMIAYNCVKEP